ncbi:PDR/VanB family oxidoreductase [Acidocella sp.]|uniref:PDR/VanB family oxidoreductase n=1 Tax=Acidocella sp. TaxID=50710 RepID=UPI003D009A59
MDANQPMHRLVVLKRQDDAGNIMRLRLGAVDASPLPAFGAGAHLDILVPGQDAPLWRQYSLSSDPADTSFYEVGILKDPASRGGSLALHEHVVEGMSLLTEGPRNHFPLEEQADFTVLIAGGIGITPILAMARRLSALGRAFMLHYCTRSAAGTAFLDDLAGAPFRNHVVFHHDDLPSTQRFDPARDMPAPASGVHLYVCGPAGFMDWIIAAAQARGYANANIHREYFAATLETGGESFEVEARASGVTVTVGPDDTITKALARAGVKIEVKCEEGVCGTCVTTVLEGTPDHRDKFLTEDERASGEEICACCSRACGARLVLDV